MKSDGVALSLGPKSPEVSRLRLVACFPTMDHATLQILCPFPTGYQTLADSVWFLSREVSLQ